MSLFKTPPPGMDMDGNPLPVKPTLFKPVAETMQQKIQRIQEMDERIKLRKGLPFLYGWMWYKWARTFYESTNKINLLVAANQISKSSTQIRKCIHWATAQDLWPSLWLEKPVQFWYLYPTQKQVNAEFETKWKQFLPAGEFKNDPYYGWREEKNKEGLVAIHFNSGVHVYFKTYAQKEEALQSGTCDAIFCDEELPFEHYEELMFRLTSTDGYFHMVFTATLGQDFWRRAMEPQEGEEENLPHALKMTVSLYDAMYYEDGTPSKWTHERIARVRANCSTQLEVLKRVYGKFIVIGGRKYESFDITKHFVPRKPVPSNWNIYSGADIGSGGTQGHKSALVYVAVSPDYRSGKVFLGWQGANGVDTTAGDVVEKNIELRKKHSINPTQQFYDWASKDFQTISTRMGDPWTKAEKGHDVGENVINTLFKNNMLEIYDDEDGELIKLASQLATLLKKTPKEKANDDIADAFRYSVTRIPWDWSYIADAQAPLVQSDDDENQPVRKPMTDDEYRAQEITDRRKAFEPTEENSEMVHEEIGEWNDLYGN